MTTELTWKRIRAGRYETGHEIEGAYVIRKHAITGWWFVSRWTMTNVLDAPVLELKNIKSGRTLANAKELAEFDSRSAVTA